MCIPDLSALSDAYGREFPKQENAHKGWGSRSCPSTLARAGKGNLVLSRQIRYTVFCRGADDSVVQGGILTFAQGVDGCNIPACRGVYYAGNFPPVVS